MSIDKKSEERLNLIYPDVAVRYKRIFNSFLNLEQRHIRVTEGLRSIARQDKLWRQGRDRPGIVVTNSKAGNSLHHYGCAIDSCFRGKDPYLEKEKDGLHFWKSFGRVAESMGFVWGGHFSGLLDMPHVQLTYGLTLSEIKDLYDFGGLRAVWIKFDKIRGVESGSEWSGPNKDLVIEAESFITEE